MKICVYGAGAVGGLIAGRLGMKPETLSRSLAKLRAFGVETTGRELMIRDVGALRAHFDED